MLNKAKKTFIIAEAGVNHNGDVEIAKKLIDAAKEAGADAVKFQTFVAKKLVTMDTPKARYQRGNSDISGTQFEMLEKLQLSPSDMKKLFDYSREKNITFMSTPFDEESADLLDALGVDIFKIGSGELTNRQLIQHIAEKRKTIILSTGMSYLGEIEKAIQWIRERSSLKMIKKSSHEELSKYPLVLLHCVSSYPCPYEEVNLKAIETLRMAFGIPVGYSDHTLGTEASIAAVALGAAVIEKHMTLDRNMEGPDHKASLEPIAFAGLVKNIRNVESSMGDGIKKPAECEKDIMRVARRSLVAKRKISKNRVITADDIDIKRPGTGIQAEFKDIIVGMKAKTDIDADSLIQWKDLKD
jgi:N,N'-diacetyllegionaminate synthase